jgi:hypothetical protein
VIAPTRRAPWRLAGGVVVALAPLVLGPRAWTYWLGSGGWLARYLSRSRNRYRLTPDMQYPRLVTGARWEAGLATLEAALGAEARA